MRDTFLNHNFCTFYLIIQIGFTGPTSCLTPALYAVVIGYWAESKQFNGAAHIFTPHHNIFTYRSKVEAGDQGFSELKRQLVTTFTSDGQTVMDCSPEAGIVKCTIH